MESAQIETAAQGLLSTLPQSLYAQLTDFVRGRLPWPGNITVDLGYDARLRER